MKPVIRTLEIRAALRLSEKIPIDSPLEDAEPTMSLLRICTPAPVIRT